MNFFHRPDKKSPVRDGKIIGRRWSGPKGRVTPADGQYHIVSPVGATDRASNSATPIGVCGMECP